MDHSVLQFYDAQAAQYYKRSHLYNFDTQKQLFLEHIPASGHILDLGCGVGRWSREFIDAGYQVTALDGSAQMVALAQEKFKVQAVHSLYEDFYLADAERVDGIWALSSLVHYPEAGLESILVHIAKMLKPSGVMYASFKEQSSEHKDERYFNQFSSTGLEAYIEKIQTFSLLKPVWQTQSQDGRKQTWLNLLVKKVA